jgi:hypothetical protein
MQRRCEQRAGPGGADAEIIGADDIAGLLEK